MCKPKEIATHRIVEQCRSAESNHTFNQDPECNPEGERDPPLTEKGRQPLLVRRFPIHRLQHLPPSGPRSIARALPAAASRTGGGVRAIHGPVEMALIAGVRSVKRTVSSGRGMAIRVREALASRRKRFPADESCSKGSTTKWPRPVPGKRERANASLGHH